MVVRIDRFIIGVIVFFAIATQAFVSSKNELGLVNFFSYFTVLSNVLVSFSLITQSLKTFDQEKTDLIRGAATLYILITGLAFTILLDGKNDQFLDWVNFVLHYVTPLFMLSDWIITPTEKITFKKSTVWFYGLAIYMIYYFVRGWYPYEFLNPQIIGLNGVTIYITILSASVLGLDLLLINANTALRVHRKPIV